MFFLLIFSPLRVLLRHYPLFAFFLCPPCVQVLILAQTIQIYIRFALSSLTLPISSEDHWQNNRSVYFIPLAVNTVNMKIYEVYIYIYIIDTGFLANVLLSPRTWIFMVLSKTAHAVFAHILQEKKAGGGREDIDVRRELVSFSNHQPLFWIPLLILCPQKGNKATSIYEFCKILYIYISRNNTLYI